MSGPAVRRRLLSGVHPDAHETEPEDPEEHERSPHVRSSSCAFQTEILFASLRGPRYCPMTRHARRVRRWRSTHSMEPATKIRKTIRATATSAISFTAYEDPLKNDDPVQGARQPLSQGHRPAGADAHGRRGRAARSAFGGHRRVRQAMDRLENNIEAGDRTIDIVGFSRGAALAISFANEIAKKMPRRVDPLHRRVGHRRPVRRAG